MPTPPRSGSGAALVVALDVPGAREAEALARTLAPLNRHGVWLKVGLELFCGTGPGIVRTLKALGFPVFLDLKFHDIPNTVAKAVRNACALGADMLTVHASGGERMLRAAVEARDAADAANRALLFAVTVLTSMAPEDLAPLGIADSQGLRALVTRLAITSHACGMDGVVSSPHEATLIKAAAPQLACLTPGIRLASNTVDDQRRVATPAQAVAMGANFLVVGRPITAAQDPVAAAQAFLTAMNDATAGP